jgi:hypothetical protein
MQEIKSAVAEKPTEREGTEGISPQRHRGHEVRMGRRCGFVDVWKGVACRLV